MSMYIKTTFSFNKQKIQFLHNHFHAYSCQHNQSITSILFHIISIMQIYVSFIQSKIQFYFLIEHISQALFHIFLKKCCVQPTKTWLHFIHKSVMSFTSCYQTNIFMQPNPYSIVNSNRQSFDISQ